MKRFSEEAKTATRVALVIVLISIPSWTQIPGTAENPPPAWATLLFLIGFFALLALLALLVARAVVAVVSFIRGRSDPASRSDDSAGLRHRLRGGTLRSRLAIVTAIPVLYVGLAMSVDTSESQWVFPDREVGLIGIVLIIIGAVLLVVGVRAATKHPDDP